MTHDTREVEGDDLVGKHANRIAFLHSRQADEKHYPFIKKLTDDEYTVFRDLVRDTIHHQLQKAREEERVKVIKEIHSLNPSDWLTHYALYKGIKLGHPELDHPTLEDKE